MAQFYTLRDIPEDLHAAWKSAAAHRQISMREYAFLAIGKLVKFDFAPRKEKKDEQERTGETRIGHF